MQGSAVHFPYFVGERPRLGLVRDDQYGLILPLGGVLQNGQRQAGVFIIQVAGGLVRLRLKRLHLQEAANF
ncbi:MAG: hypothetical protein IJI53_03345, partial [Clostridia bacterium]|nr:hypothetical protein [Clostridia bacterium]